MYIFKVPNFFSTELFILFFILLAVNFRDCWTNKVDSVKCDGHTNSLKLCYCANSDFCNCHNNPNLNGEECPIPPSSTNKVCLPITLLLVSLFIITFTNRLEV